MTRGQFEAQVNRAWGLLREFEMGVTRNIHPQYPRNAAAVFRDLSYVDTWRKCYIDGFFDFELPDKSLIQFRVEGYSPLKVSYSYYECPFILQGSFEDLLAAWDVAADSEEATELREDFDSFAEPQPKEMSTPIRYDYDISSYMEGRHPASHFHFGHANNIRIATRKILKPLSFIFFILRQVYPDVWQKLLERQDASLLAREIAASLNDVGEVYWRQRDEWELFLR